MVGHMPLEHGIGVRIPVRQHFDKLSASLASKIGEVP